MPVSSGSILTSILVTTGLSRVVLASFGGWMKAECWGGCRAIGSGRGMICPRAGLRELRGLLARELGVPGDRAHVPRVEHVLGVERVPAVLAGLARAGDERSGWWERTRACCEMFFRGVSPRRRRGGLLVWSGKAGCHRLLSS